MQEEQSYATTKEAFEPKKNSKNQFDVSMGANDGAEICELVELYILTEVHKNIDFTSVGLYRDDALAVMRSASGSSLDRNSNHPPTILSMLPQTISKRISSLLYNFELFSRAGPIYNAALENAGYAERVKYNS